MMTKRTLLSIVIAVCGVLVSITTSHLQSREELRGELREEFHQTYPLRGAGGRVSLENINGPVRISVWERDEVRVDAVKRAFDRERLAEAEIKIDASGDALYIKTEYPNSWTNWTNDERGRHRNPASVDYTLTVPRSVRLDEIKLINGALDIEGVTGAVTASSINGRLTAKGLAGEAKLSVINGRLEATFDRLDPSHLISLSSVNGGIHLTIPSDANAEVKASTVHGGISNDFGLPVRRGEYVGRDLNGVIGQGGARIKLSNVNGTIDIKRANDGRATSPARNLLSTARKDDDENENDKDNDGIINTREINRTVNSAVRNAQREAERATREAQREVERATREAERDVEDANRDIQINSINKGRDARQIQRETKSFPVGASPRVRIETFDGNVTVRAWDKSEVMYNAVKRAADDREMSGVRLRADQSGSQVTIHAEFDNSFSREVVKRAGRVASYSSNASVDLEVYVPRSAVLNASSGDGRLRIEDVDGEINLHTGDGAVDVTGGRGTLRIDTGDGHIRISNFDGAAEARTGDGRITLDGRFTKLTAQTGDGAIALSVPSDSNLTIETDAESVVNDGLATAEDADSSQRKRRWRIGQGGNLATLRTGDGQIILRPKR